MALQIGNGKQNWPGTGREKDFSLKAMENSVSQLLQPQGFLAVADTATSSQEALMSVSALSFSLGGLLGLVLQHLSCVGSNTFHNNRAGEKNVK